MKRKPVDVKLEDWILRDRVFRVARGWSNTELRWIGQLISGDVVNVSAYRDEDKQGAYYRGYFPHASSYTLTNFKQSMSGFQGEAGEIFLDLELGLPESLQGKFDCVFNHTTLEHVYEFRKAFANLCGMSRDLVVVVVPWLQENHTDYGDYWRFSPSAVARLFDENGFTNAYISWNDDPGTSVYVLGVGTRHPERWVQKFPFSVDPHSANFLRLPQNAAGRYALPSSTLRPFLRKTIEMAKRVTGRGRKDPNEDSA